jgi:hypothetical protein
MTDTATAVKVMAMMILRRSIDILPDSVEMNGVRGERKEERDASTLLLPFILGQ